MGAKALRVDWKKELCRLEQREQRQKKTEWPSYPWRFESGHKSNFQEATKYLPNRVTPVDLNQQPY
jgi:hypothetical protein